MNCSEDMIEATNERVQAMFAETAILLTHPDVDRRALAKERVFALLFPEARSRETTSAVQLAYGLLWHMQIDRDDPNLRLASDARKALLAVLSKDGQLRGIDAAKAADAKFTGAA